MVSALLEKCRPAIAIQSTQGCDCARGAGAGGAPQAVEAAVSGVEARGERRAALPGGGERADGEAGDVAGEQAAAIAVADVDAGAAHRGRVGGEAGADLDGG